MESTEPPIPPCWCGGQGIRNASHPAYVYCVECGTSRLRDASAHEPPKVSSSENGLYGEEYWFSHQADLGYPDIRRRARADLPERCQYWLSTVLRYALPPGKVLELGCAHGGFLALCEAAGFETTGVEMSPSIVSFARETFRQNVLVGPLERLGLPPATYDVAFAFDVVEHLVHPLESLQQTARLLKPGGIIIVQTPEFRLSRDPGWHHGYKPPEHVFLYTRASLTQIMSRVGFVNVAWRPALFQGDMFAVFGRQAIKEYSEEDRGEALTKNPASRLVLAMLDMQAANERELADVAETWRRLSDEDIGRRRGLRSALRILRGALKARLWHDVARRSARRAQAKDSLR